MSIPDGPYLFIGAGGMGMAPLAYWMSRAGHKVVGYDAHLQERVRQWLDASGVEHQGFVFPEQIRRFAVVVYSSAVSSEHALLVAARGAGILCLRRGEMLARIAATRKLIAVVGSHGKTTTTGMIAHALCHCEIEANYILGGLFRHQAHAPSAYSESEWLVAEVDESDGTIDLFAPDYTVVLNLDWDHADHYGDPARLEAAFVQLLDRTGEAVLIPESLSSRYSPRSELRVFDGAAARLGLEVVPKGRFNRANADAAAAALELLARPLKTDALASFPGIARRQVTLYEDPSLTVLEDYAHHPTEIDGLVDCLRGQAPDRRLLLVFQPHRYSRTREFKSAFARSLSAADEVFLLPVYGAHENPLVGGELSDLANAFEGEAPACLEMTRKSMIQLSEALGSRAVHMAFVGAGNIEDFAAAFVSWQRTKGSLDAAFVDYLQGRLSRDARLKTGEPLANKTTLRIGGDARFYAEPANLSDLHVLLQAAKLFSVDLFCLGRGSNLLVSDEGFDGLVIRLSLPHWRRIEALSQGRIWAAAGGRLKEICGFAAKNGIGGFEFLEGIPGAVGGALRMNAGAMGSWMFDIVERVQFIDESGRYQDLPKEAFHFGYRKVEEVSRGIALGAILKSADAATESSIRGRIDTYSSTRKESQPRGASAGCIFKNPEGNYAGKLIDELGIKGMRVGAAEVSPIHGNFIVNQGGARAADVLELIRRIRAKVKEESGYILEPEVLLVGQSWDEVLGE